MPKATSRKVALVTGASRGIGKAIATRLGADGFYVVGTATSSEGAAAIDAALGEKGAGVPLRIDDDGAADAVERIAERFGTPLVLVNNAGVTRDNLLLRMTAEQWSTVLNTNLTGLYRLTRPLLRGMMRARWGRIVNLSSVVGRMGNAGQANYAAAKAGIEGFTRALAQEVGSRGITVNAVAPGFVDTDMTSGSDGGSTPGDGIAHGARADGYAGRRRRGGGLSGERCRRLRDRRDAARQRRLVQRLSAGA